MRITIYVKVKQLELMKRFLDGEEIQSQIKWQYERFDIDFSTYVEITISYDDYVRLNS